VKTTLFQVFLFMASEDVNLEVAGADSGPPATLNELSAAQLASKATDLAQNGMPANILYDFWSGYFFKSRPAKLDLAP
jgi:hypothetical protein